MVAQLTSGGALDNTFGTAGVELFNFGTKFSLESVNTEYPGDGHRA